MQKASFPFRDLIRNAGFKATPRRIAVLDALKKARKPISPQHIAEMLEDRANQSTVYRICKSFKARGIIRQVDFRHNHPHYELSDPRDHHHVICSSCGLSEEILRCDVESMRTHMLASVKRFKEIREHTLEFYGICKTCAS